jgi:AbrB family looped-hinge helix DNA binding protein
MRVTTKGQVTIPLEIRTKLGLLPNTEVVFELADDSVKIRKAKDQTRGQALISHMRGRGAIRMSTDEIMALTRGE